MHEMIIQEDFQDIYQEAKLFEAYSAQEIQEHLESLPQDSVIFVDIDDTIITPSSKAFRSPPSNTINGGIKNIIDEIKSHKEKYPNYQDIISNWRLRRKVVLLDDHWPTLTNQLKERHFIYGLTKMDVGKFGLIPSIEEWRYKELESLGVQFSQNDLLPSDILDGASFFKGIFFTGENSKSQTIGYYLSVLKPLTIVMIDDRFEHLKDIQFFCKQQGINFWGIHYKGLEKLTDLPNPNVVNFQKEYLIRNMQWLEDDEAELQMNGKNFL